MSDQFFVVVFAEGDYDCARKFDTREEAEAFRDGVQTGAGRYGGDGCSAYVWPDDRAEMEKRRRAAEVQKARAAIHGMGGPAAPEVIGV